MFQYFQTILRTDWGNILGPRNDPESYRFLVVQAVSFLAALKWFGQANLDAFRLEERPTDGIFSDFVGQLERLRLNTYRIYPDQRGS